MVDPFVPLIRTTLEKYPDAARQPPVRDGARARLHRRPRSLPPRRGALSAGAGGRSLSAACAPCPASRRRWTGATSASCRIGRAERALWGFVMVLSYSRQIFLRFFFGNAMANFLRGHVGAFDSFAGVPRVLLYDNLKSAVLERVGQAIHFNPTLLELAAHYRFEPRPVAVARGNEKGRVERAIRYIRDSFFAARELYRSGRPQRPGHGVVRRDRRRAPVSRGSQPARARGVCRRTRASAGAARQSLSL